jgi:hypothetical protein
MTLARQEDLPGMVDRKLKDLHEAALSYADLRDARIAASAPEIKAKGDLLDLMKKHELEHYKYDGVEITITHEKENVRVKIESQSIGGEDHGDAKMRAANDDSMPELPAEQRKAVKAVKTKKKKAKGKK